MFSRPKRTHIDNAGNVFCPFVRRGCLSRHLPLFVLRFLEVSRVFPVQLRGPRLRIQAHTTKDIWVKTCQTQASNELKQEPTFGESLPHLLQIPREKPECLLATSQAPYFKSKAHRSTGEPGKSLHFKDKSGMLNTYPVTRIDRSYLGN